MEVQVYLPETGVSHYTKSRRKARVIQLESLKGSDDNLAERILGRHVRMSREEVKTMLRGSLEQSRGDLSDTKKGI